MAVRLGVAPIAWSNDDLPELGGDTPLETCLAESRVGSALGLNVMGIRRRGRLRLAPDPALGKHGCVCGTGTTSLALLARRVAVTSDSVSICAGGSKRILAADCADPSLAHAQRV